MKFWNSLIVAGDGSLRVLQSAGSILFLDLGVGYMMCLVYENLSSLYTFEKCTSLSVILYVSLYTSVKG